MNGVSPGERPQPRTRLGPLRQCTEEAASTSRKNYWPFLIAPMEAGIQSCLLESAPCQNPIRIDRGTTQN